MLLTRRRPLLRRRDDVELRRFVTPPPHQRKHEDDVDGDQHAGHARNPSHVACNESAKGGHGALRLSGDRTAELYTFPQSSFLAVDFRAGGTEFGGLGRMP